MQKADFVLNTILKTCLCRHPEFISGTVLNIAYRFQIKASSRLLEFGMTCIFMLALDSE